MYIPENAEALLDNIIRETDQLIKSIPRVDRENYGNSERRRDIYVANARFIGFFHNFLANWFGIKPGDFSYVVELQEPVPRVVHDGEPGRGFRLALRYWNKSGESQGSVSVQLPKEMEQIFLCLDFSHAHRGDGKESLSVLVYSFFMLRAFKDFCSACSAGHPPENLAEDRPIVMVNMRTGRVSINQQYVKSSHRVADAVAYMIDQHSRSRCYFDRKDLLKHIRVFNNPSLKDLFSYYAPIWKLVKQALDKRGKHMTNKYYFDIDTERSFVER